MVETEALSGESLVKVELGEAKEIFEFRPPKMRQMLELDKMFGGLDKIGDFQSFEQILQFTWILGKPSPGWTDRFKTADDLADFCLASDLPALTKLATDLFADIFPQAEVDSQESATFRE